MLAAPAAAIAPFLDGTVSIRTATRGAEQVPPLAVAACVRESSPFEIGQTPGATTPNAWTVSLLASSLGSAVIVPGATIEPGATWPRLVVRSVSTCGGVVHLRCSGRER